MSVKLLTEHHLAFLSLKGGYTGSTESTLVKMPHCWKYHVTAHFENKMARSCITRGIWKVLSMVFYLSNLFTNPIMFGINLKNYLFSMLWQIFVNISKCLHEKYYCEYMYCLYTGKRKIFSGKYNIYLLKSVQNINNISCFYIILYH